VLFRSVIDDGIGIPADMLESVFELFTQADPSDRRARPGLGIGLTLARSLVELHGGSIHARSSGRNAGSEFIVRLPARSASPDLEPVSAPRHSVELRRKILIADGNEDSAVSLSVLLDAMGHETRIAYDGMAALAAAEVFQPEVVIVDIDMPKLDGYEVARALLARPWARETRLIAMTAWARESDPERGRQAGFHAHLIKPVAFDTLQAALIQGDEQ